MLAQPGAFEPLTERPWDEARVRAAIAEIVADADAAYHPDGLWPADEWDAWTCPTSLKGLYVGAAGVVWALDALRRGGHAETGLDLAAVSQRALELWREAPDFPAGIELPTPARAGLFSGETGVLAVAWGQSPDASLADTLFECVSENAANDANELLWGAPGTMLVSALLLARTGDERWARAWGESAGELVRRRDADGLWTQRLFGEEVRALGAAHGAAGNVLALLRGGDLLDADRRAALERETADLFARTAVVDGGLANWPIAEGRPLEGSDGAIRLQWCMGGPGIITCTAGCLDEELLLAGAELTWRAGPPGLEKGPCLCHGTAGNGFALLKTFERTRDEHWLARARRFAVHALEQVERLRESRGRGRYSLFTGDVGAALFAARCLEAHAAFPILDSFE